MKAIVHERFGGPEVLELKDIDKPALEADRVLVKVRASSVNPADWHSMTGTPLIARMAMGLTKPKRTVAGLDVAGIVEAVGNDVEALQPGDEVYGEAAGTYAEYAAVRGDLLAPKPSNLSFEEAATVPVAAFTALQGLRDHGKLQPGHKVLVNGASGGVGTFAVQIAKALGGGVTAVCSTRNVDMVRSIGADRVIDYTTEDFTKSGHYDLLLDCVGNRSLSDSKQALTADGIYVAVGAPKQTPALLARLAGMMWGSRFGGHRTVFFVAKASGDDLLVLNEMFESGTVKPVIDRRYELSEVPAAMRYQGEGHAQGKTVITV